jgi:hypothetical protein
MAGSRRRSFLTSQIALPNTKGNRLVLIRYDKAENDVMILTILVGTLAPAK